MSDVHAVSGSSQRYQTPISELDFVLGAQIIVAWAGERGDEGGDRRLGWWHSMLISPDAGLPVLEALVPRTASWAVVQGAREAARRVDAAMRGQEYDPDRYLSLFNLGFEVDERLEDRLQDLKRSGASPTECLPQLAEFLGKDWDRNAFEEWAGSSSEADVIVTPTGRRLRSQLPPSLDATVYALLAGLLPIGPKYPLPHFLLPP